MLEGLNLYQVYPLSIFRGGCWERGGGGCRFCIKNKLKSEIFNDKKVLFSVIAKNLNWEIGLRMNNFTIIGVQNQIFRGEGT